MESLRDKLNRALGQGRGRGRATAVRPEDDPNSVPVGRGRGRGISIRPDDDANTAPVGRGRGRPTQICPVDNSVMAVPEDRIQRMERVDEQRDLITAALLRAYELPQGLEQQFNVSQPGPDVAPVSTFPQPQRTSPKEPEQKKIRFEALPETAQETAQAPPESGSHKRKPNLGALKRSINIPAIEPVDKDDDTVSSFFRRFEGTSGPIDTRQESAEETRKRLEREKKQKWRAQLTEEEKQKIRDADKLRHSLRKATETDEESAARRAANTSSHHFRRVAETAEETNARRTADNVSHLLRQLNETDEETEARRAANVISQRSTRASETAEQTDARHAADNVSHLWRQAVETYEENEARRAANAVSQQSIRAAETAAETEARRAADVSSHYFRRTAETAAETEARRAADASSHHVRRAAETAEESDARRAADASSHHVRRAAETAEETEARRATDAAAHRQESQQQQDEIRATVEYQSQRGSLHFRESSVVPHDCGPMDSRCQFCGSYNFGAERPRDRMFNSCCHKGKVRLNRNPIAYPSFLESLLSHPSDPNYRNFREHIRSYNSAVSFASMGAKYREVPGHGPYVFQVQGQVYHRTSHLTGGNNPTKQYAQLYVLDSTQATNIRMQHPANQGLDPEILDRIDRFFRANNILARSYRMMREVQEAEALRAQRENRNVPVVTLEFSRDRQADQRRYNEPTSNEISMVFVDEDGEPPFERDIRVYPQNPANPQHHFINIDILSPNLDPMTYAILFPYGEAGWQRGFTCMGYDNKSHNVSMLQYKVANTAIRDYFNPVMSAGKLTQQWIVDSYLQVEANNLNYIRFNQSRLRTELYQGLADHIANRSAAAGVMAGRPIILPSSFEGSPRNMRQRLQDALSIFGKFGSLDVFVTFTANPNWKEIQENLRPGETASDRPDLVDRVFAIKLKALMEDLTVNMVLGRCIAFVYTIEFQKRSLPHSQILLVLQEEDKFTTPERIDDVVCAEIPNEAEYPNLFEIVTRCMLHGPCGGANSTAPCMKDGKCSKDFPKDFIEFTSNNRNGYANYRRRIGPTVQKGRHTYDNRSVVPYNKYLLLKYDAHINVEVCTSMRAVKYIYKYIYKGFDCANITIGVDQPRLVIHDEVKNFIDARYVSAPEAMWRLLEFKMHDRSHAIIRLPVHLPNQQEIQFEVGREQEALDVAQGRDTKLHKVNGMVQIESEGSTC